MQLKRAKLKARKKLEKRTTYPLSAALCVGRFLFRRYDITSSVFQKTLLARLKVFCDLHITLPMLYQKELALSPIFRVPCLPSATIGGIVIFVQNQVSIVSLH